MLDLKIKIKYQHFFGTCCTNDYWRLNSSEQNIHEITFSVVISRIDDDWIIRHTPKDDYGI
jgi:hypothetical protein